MHQMARFPPVRRSPAEHRARRDGAPSPERLLPPGSFPQRSRRAPAKPRRFERPQPRAQAKVAPPDGSALFAPFPVSPSRGATRARALPKGGSVPDLRVAANRPPPSATGARVPLRIDAAVEYVSEVPYDAVRRRRLSRAPVISPLRCEDSLSAPPLEAPAPPQPEPSPSRRARGPKWVDNVNRERQQGDQHALRCVSTRIELAEDGSRGDGDSDAESDWGGLEPEDAANEGGEHELLELMLLRQKKQDAQDKSEPPNEPFQRWLPEAAALLAAESSSATDLAAAAAAAAATLGPSSGGGPGGPGGPGGAKKRRGGLDVRVEVTALATAGPRLRALGSLDVEVDVGGAERSSALVLHLWGLVEAQVPAVLHYATAVHRGAFEFRWLRGAAWEPVPATELVQALSSWDPELQHEFRLDVQYGAPADAGKSLEAQNRALKTELGRLGYQRMESTEAIAQTEEKVARSTWVLRHAAAKVAACRVSQHDIAFLKTHEAVANAAPAASILCALCVLKEVRPSIQNGQELLERPGLVDALANPAFVFTPGRAAAREAFQAVQREAGGGRAQAALARRGQKELVGLPNPLFAAHREVLHALERLYLPREELNLLNPRNTVFPSCVAAIQWLKSVYAYSVLALDYFAEQRALVQLRRRGLTLSATVAALERVSSALGVMKRRVERKRRTRPPRTVRLHLLDAETMETVLLMAGPHAIATLSLVCRDFAESCGADFLRTLVQNIRNRFARDLSHTLADTALQSRLQTRMEFAQRQLTAALALVRDTRSDEPTRDSRGRIHRRLQPALQAVCVAHAWQPEPPAHAGDPPDYWPPVQAALRDQARFNSAFVKFQPEGLGTAAFDQLKALIALPAMQPYRMRQLSAFAEALTRWAAAVFAVRAVYDRQFRLQDSLHGVHIPLQLLAAGDTRGVLYRLAVECNLLDSQRGGLLDAPKDDDAEEEPAATSKLEGDKAAALMKKAKSRSRRREVGPPPALSAGGGLLVPGGAPRGSTAGGSSSPSPSRGGSRRLTSRSGSPSSPSRGSTPEPDSRGSTATGSSPAAGSRRLTSRSGSPSTPSRGSTPESDSRRPTAMAPRSPSPGAPRSRRPTSMSPPPGLEAKD